MIIRKFLMIALSLSVITGCQSMRDMDEGDEYEVVKSEKSAEKINEKTMDQVEQVEVSDKVYFDFDKFNLKRDAKKTLDLQSEWLKQEKSIKILIEGHCDERGTREYNYALGMRRANAVKEYLVKKGISKRRMKTVSYGEDRPMLVGSGERVWSKNRRAVTVVVE
ncbi:peptidoglycan-associated lipoprotein Pal [Pseudomonadota bacterium]